MILGVDRGWRITACNRALLELTGMAGRDPAARPRHSADFLTGRPAAST